MGRTVTTRALRPNQLVAAALPDGPLGAEVVAAAVIDATAPLLTPLGLRSLGPDDHRYRGEHRGDSAARDTAYHQGTVWPWLIGSYVEASLRASRSTDELLGVLGIASRANSVSAQCPRPPTLRLPIRLPGPPSRPGRV